MGKIAFVFPGQGAQVVGMGKSITDNYPESMEIIDRADAVLDFDLKALCFEENNEINITEFTQPALLAVSVAILKAVETLGLKADYVAGLSLGEYTALVANGALDFEEAVDLVRKRGQFMEAAAKKTKGSMSAIMGSSREANVEACRQAGGAVSVANYNSPAQIVIAGEVEALKRAGEILAGQGAKVIPLTVSGAFHSALMANAAQNLKTVLADKTIHPFTVPYVTNVTGGLVTEGSGIKDLLVEQVQGSVYWEDCVRTLIEQGVDTFVEIGPGKTLAGLIKKIDRSKKVINVDNMEGILALKAFMEV